MDNHYSQRISVHMVSQHSQLFRTRRSLLRYPQVTNGKHKTTFRSVSDKSSVFTALVSVYSILWFYFICKQFTNSCAAAWQLQTQQGVHTPHFLDMCSLVPYCAIKPENVQSSKNFRGYPRPRKYFHTKINESEHNTT